MDADAQDTITFQGDFYNGVDNQWGVYTPTLNSPMNCDTTRFLTRWARKVDEDTDWEAQFYYYSPYAVGYNLNSVAAFDGDFKYHMKRNRHDIVCGLEYRNYDEEWHAGTTYKIAGSEQIPSYFFQDTLTVIEDRLFLTCGAKFDYDSTCPLQFQPTIRLMWTPDEKISISGADHPLRPNACTRRTIIRHSQRGRRDGLEIGIRQQMTDRFFWVLVLKQANLSC